VQPNGHQKPFLPKRKCHLVLVGGSQLGCNEPMGMKNNTKVMIHQEIVDGPIAAEGANVSMVRIAQMLKSIISRLRSTFLKPRSLGVEFSV
jgi:hypothetical protein